MRADTACASTRPAGRRGQSSERVRESKGVAGRVCVPTGRQKGHAAAHPRASAWRRRQARAQKYERASKEGTTRAEGSGGRAKEGAAELVVSVPVQTGDAGPGSAGQARSAVHAWSPQRAAECACPSRRGGAAALRRRSPAPSPPQPSRLQPLPAYRYSPPNSPSRFLYSTCDGRGERAFAARAQPAGRPQLRSRLVLCFLEVRVRDLRGGAAWAA